MDKCIIQIQCSLVTRPVRSTSRVYVYGDRDRNRDRDLDRDRDRDP